MSLLKTQIRYAARLYAYNVLLNCVGSTDIDPNDFGVSWDDFEVFESELENLAEKLFQKKDKAHHCATIEQCFKIASQE